MADTAAEESVQAVDFRAGQNFGEAQGQFDSATQSTAASGKHLVRAVAVV